MRTLALLRGIQGAGKSTWIKENNLEQYTLNADNIRLLHRSPIIKEDGSLTIDNKADGAVWSTLMDLLEYRMNRGEFTIIDATHSKNDMINMYKKLAQKYRYRVVVVDFSDVPLEQALQQNKMRPDYKFVPEDVIENAYERIKNNKAPSWVTSVKPHEFFDYLDELSKPLDFNKWKKIHHIGDVHGCYTALMEYLDGGELKDDELYIFTGDYVDRGIENGETMDYLLTVYDKPNVIMLEGNHEIHLWNYANDYEINSRVFINDTIPQIKHIPKDSLRKFYRKLRQIVTYEYYGRKYVVTHGGLPKYPENTMFIATEQLIKGVGSYEVDIDDIWDKNEDLNTIQIHGHRNIYRIPLDSYNSFNLEGQVEFGGHLRVLVLEESAFIPVEIKNNVFKPRKVENVKVNKHMTVEQALELMQNHKFIAEKELTPSISSFNFTKSAFTKRKWDDLNVQARGLFINKNTKKIVSRSYDKFFNINEMEDTKISHLADNLKFPVKVYTKPNGYLGLVGYDEETDELVFSSKSQIYGDHAKWLEELFYKHFRDYQVLEIKNLLKYENATMVFEVISMTNDPHIIKYEGDKLILLDIVKRTMNFNKSSYEFVLSVANVYGLECKNLKEVIYDWVDFYNWYKDISNDFTVEEEGYVIEDASGFMFKIKLPYYNFWKSMRGLISIIAKGNEGTIRGGSLNTAQHQRVFKWMKDNRECIKKMNIIEIRDEFEKSQIELNAK